MFLNRKQRAHPKTLSAALATNPKTNTIFPNPWRSDEDPRRFELVHPGLGSTVLETMIYGDRSAELRPLLILNSIEFPMPPSIEFCELMRHNGLQVVFMRRPGFGASTTLPEILLNETNILNGAACVTEAAIISQAIFRLKLENVVFLGIGSANSVGFRLCQMNADITLSIFSNAVFNQESWESFRPVWFQKTMQQTVLTRGGFKIAAKGLKFYLKRNPISFFEQLLVKSEADQKYCRANEQDFLAASYVMRDVQAETFFYDLTMAMQIDPFLKNEIFAHLNCVVLSGPETTPHWLKRTKEEADRLGVSVVGAPRGGMFVAYAAPETVLEIVEASKSLIA